MGSWLKKILILIVICGIYLMANQLVFAASNDSADTDRNLSNNQLLEEVSLQDTNEFWENIKTDYGAYLPDLQGVSLRQFLQDQNILSMKDWFKAIITYIGYEILASGELLGTLIVLSLCSIVLHMIQNSFESSTVSKVSDLVVILVLFVLAMQSFQVASSYVTETVMQMRDFMVALLPLMLGLMASFGSLTAVSFFHPIIVSCMHITVLLINYLIIPLFFISAILQMVSALNDSFQVTKLAQLLKNTGLALLGILLTIFLSVVSVQGATSAIQDGVAMKTTKFVTGNFIPVVGKLFTDATDTVLSASLLLKNAVGIVGVIILIVIVLFPAIKIFVISFIYKISIAIIQPLGNGPVLKCLDIMSKHILYLFAALLTVSLMFFLMIVIIVIASNITLMLR
ncbi:Stage III sporulation protein AE precursor [Paraliobacillus sp. PM-2]|uniref:stage III sporulation protein AE n=1 Tax=Paraliobacillus sp. PM-2 TaxID=1462524 RepID=UPI00061CC5E0|nr:stage III sporulation protein AE [Paraliobacillus sp. PM-2]CQR46793.1 Stage III sporulation protein AE precursor [Paraliobacillus sp. PM-2]